MQDGCFLQALRVTHEEREKRISGEKSPAIEGANTRGKCKWIKDAGWRKQEDTRLEENNDARLRTEREKGSVGAPPNLKAPYRVNVRRICKYMEMGKEGWGGTIDRTRKNRKGRK